MSYMKFFEVRDSATFIPVVAVRASASAVVEGWLLARAGWAFGEHPIHVFRLDERGRGFSDPEEWGTQTRTMIVAHRHIIERWDALASGDVIDVGYILGLREEPKTSERLGEPRTMLDDIVRGGS